MKALKELYETVAGRLLRVFYSEKGQTMVEYGLLIVLIAIMLIVAVGYLRGGVETAYCKAGNELSKP